MLKANTAPNSKTGGEGAGCFHFVGEAVLAFSIIASRNSTLLLIILLFYTKKCCIPPLG